jgi:predicted nucleic acid-binding protein
MPLLKAYRERATLVQPKALPKPACRDRDDDKVLADAVAGKADSTLTGDDDLFVFGEYDGIRILPLPVLRNGGRGVGKGYMLRR